MDLIADVVVVAAGAAVVAVYTWALRGHFVSRTMQRRAQVISAVVLVSAATFIWLGVSSPQPLAAQIVGLALEAASLVLFFSAIRESRQAQLRFAFDPTRPETLVTSGPYGLVRHPFYVSYLMFWIGWAIAVWSVFALVNVVVILILYVVAARFEERNFEGSALAADYAAYRKRVGFFVPRL